LSSSSDGGGPAPEGTPLGAYVLRLVEGVAAAEPASFARLREVVGARSAIVAVDSEAVRLRFEGDALRVEPVAPGEGPPGPVDGMGEIDRQTVLRLLAGQIEVTEAIRRGFLRVRGAVDDVVRMGLALEIIIDVAVRAPFLQGVAADYRNDPGRARLLPLRPAPDADAERREAEARERALLGRLGLLPGGEDGELPG
jgi:hypothetical protein